MREILVALISLFSCGDGLRFHSIFMDGMVLQREPASPIVWGFGQLLEDNQARLDCFLKERAQAPAFLIPQALLEGKTWKVTIPPQKSGSVCDLEISTGSQVIKLKQVVFGDIWLCSGQSNMEQNMANIINSTGEVEASAKYTDIRFTVIKNTVSEEADDDMEVDLEVPWDDPSNADSLRKMSAVCFLFGRNIYDNINVPIGLIASDWGGTPIEAWMNTEALDACNTPSTCDDTTCNCLWNWDQNCNSRLYNAMINPLKRLALKGFLWYQGESNANHNRDLYNCTFPSMISSWQKEFSKHSGVSEPLPFGFVQLSTINYGSNTNKSGFSVIRWHQTGDQGYVPNSSPDMEHVFMAVGADTHDPMPGYPGNLHPRYKQILSERLSIAGMNVAYGHHSFPANGPFPEYAIINCTTSLTLVYDQDFTFDDSETTGFYYCCTTFEDCDRDENNFLEIPKGQVLSTGPNLMTINLEEIQCDGRRPSFAYLWRETPVNGYLKAPIYAKDAFRLPANPWKFSLPDNEYFVRIK